MTWNRWLSALQRSARPTRRPRRDRRLTLEALEDRTLFAVSVISLAATGSATANGQSEVAPMHSVSDDGRYTVFASTATNLVANQSTDSSGSKFLNIYLYDNQQQTTTLLTHASGSGNSAKEANGNSFNAVISGDGSTVVFYSLATNLPAQTTGGQSVSVSSGTVQLYAYHVSDGTLTLVSHQSGSDSVGSNGANPAIPATGAGSSGYINTLAYSVGSAALGTGMDIMGLALPGVSTDGKYIAYISDASNLGASNTGGGSGSNGTGQTYTNVFLYDGNSSDSAYGTNTLVSHSSSSSTTSASGFASTVAISGDGTTVAFTDPANNLVSSTTSTGVNDQLYVWSRTTNSTTGLSAGQTVLASHSAASTSAGATIPTALQGGLLARLYGFTGWTADTPPSLSSDGTAVAYYFAGNNLVSNQAGTASVLNVFRYNVTNNTNALVSHVANDTATAGNNPQNKVAPVDLGPVEATAPAISKDGRYIAFANNSSNLLSTTSPFTTGSGTYDGRDQVYLYDSQNPDTLTLVSHADGSASTPLSHGGTAPGISADGRYVSFLDWALPASGSTSGQSGGAYVRLYDAQASATSIPISIGHGIDSATTNTLASSFLVPTVLSANGKAVAWDGNATDNVSGVTDNNSNLDVFLYTSSSSSSAPQITSANHTTFTAGTGGTFTVTATGSPTPTLSESGTLPNGVTFDPATGTLSGTPAAGTGGTYPVTFTASNGVGTDATQTFTLTVNETPAVTSTSSTTFTAGTAGTFTPTTTGYPAPTFTESGTLPNGVTFNTATGTLSGTPAAGTGGTYPITITAGNGVGTNASQNFTLTVNEAPSITSSSSTTFTTTGSPSFTVTTTGFPAPTFTLSGTLPSGVTFDPTTGTFSGTPAAGTAGSYTVTITASNGVGTDATQDFTLIVNQVPTFTAGGDQTILESALSSPPTQTVVNWATNIVTGSSPVFIVTNDNNALFATQPAISADGTLTYEAAQYAYGTATVSVTLTDSDGQSTSETITFTITILPVNQAPSFTAGSDQQASSANGGVSYAITGWATNILAGPPNESGQSVHFIVSTDHPELFTTAPAISADGTLTFQTADNADGVATVTVYLQDDGGTANGGQDTSEAVTFTITVSPLISTT
jgi:hypothetical protein